MVLALKLCSLDQAVGAHTFPSRPGTWRLVVPNTIGIGTGPLAVETIVVSRRVGAIEKAEGRNGNGVRGSVNSATHARSSGHAAHDESHRLPHLAAAFPVPFRSMPV